MTQTRRTEKPSERAMRETQEQLSAGIALDHLRDGDRLGEALRRVRADHGAQTQYEAETYIARRILEVSPGVSNRD